MEIQSISHSFGKDVYKLDNGTKISMKKGTGNVIIGQNNVVQIKDGEKVSVKGSKGDDKIVIENSQVNTVSLGRGRNRLFCNGCQFNDYNMFLGTGSYISTSGNITKEGECSEIVIKGDFRGMINAQQGYGKAYLRGDDSGAHKDRIIITGDNKGHVKVDTHDQVAIKGDKGHLFNETIYYM